ncbi:D-alanyl-D-alanine carboxypeptidase [Paenibacillus phyllosphaerae]|uniref:D-alanyl-D-alanine carboxypeptidase n=1 Tax=Paenibacillus phyllosphaerae TaxID=274593 RepID=A0A7W5B330_9BACL|nr:D-alanyl-D-alanine carboxypeptidase [Paenibacillus phyllosphaerae]
MYKRPALLILILATVTLSACSLENINPSSQSGESAAEQLPIQSTSSGAAAKPSSSGGSAGSTPASTAKPPVAEDKPQKTPEQKPDAVKTVANAASVTVLVNKNNRLPEDYSPSDLIYPDIKFTFQEKVEKRMMARIAADAIEQLFAAAIEDGEPLAGVSAYRSHARQKTLFESYVKRDGLEKALTYSAYPGTSEHETGLAIDVTGADGKCSATDCFGDTSEARWLADHAHEYGFIIRYPKGKEVITGYKYEPWHLRYVGVVAATAIYKQQLTLEEYDGVLEASNIAG